MKRTLKIVLAIVAVVIVVIAGLSALHVRNRATAAQKDDWIGAAPYVDTTSTLYIPQVRICMSAISWGLAITSFPRAGERAKVGEVDFGHGSKKPYFCEQ